MERRRFTLITNPEAVDAVLRDADMARHLATVVLNQELPLPEQLSVEQNPDAFSCTYGAGDDLAA